MKIRAISVSELSNYISNITKSDPILQSLSVEGEISNLKYHSSGNVYFSLKDISSKINCLIFASNAKAISNLKEGDKVICKGQLNYYEKEGSFTFLVHSADKKGVGELYLKFLDLKKTLMAEGLFDEKYKKPLPSIPKSIGVLTSTTGSVIRDIYNVTKNRYPHIQISVYPCVMQGPESANSVVKGLEYFNKNKNVDIIIIARGGGSFEELFPFNDEILARKIFESIIPVVSAVGHETDYTIADFVSDVRASTPSMAAELSVPSKQHIIHSLDTSIELIKKDLEKRMTFANGQMELLSNMLIFTHPENTITRIHSELDMAKYNINNIINMKLDDNESKIENFYQVLLASNPIIPLKKGFALIKDMENKGIKDTKSLSIDQDILVEFEDGKIIATVKEKL